MSLNDLMKDIQKKHGKDSIIKGNEFRLKTPIISSTGSYALDIALGCGGLPEGRILEYFGQPSGGKSTLAQISAIEVQKVGGIAAYIDMEGTFDRQWFNNLGGDSGKLLISSPDTGAQALDIVETMVKSNEVNFVVVDSVSAMLTQAELESDYEDQHMAQLARLMSGGLKKLNIYVKKSKCTVLYINQTRQGIGMFVSPVQTSGGNALKFYASIRLSVNRGESIGEKENPNGFITKIKVEKNKCGPPHRKVLTNLYIGAGGKYGIDTKQEVIDLAIEKGIVNKGGAWYKYEINGEEIKWQGKEKTIEYLTSNDEIYNEIKSKIEQRYIDDDVPEPGSYNELVNQEIAEQEEKPDKNIQGPGMHSFSEGYKPTEEEKENLEKEKTKRKPRK